MQTALGKPVVPEEQRIAAVCSPPSFRGSGLGYDLDTHLCRYHTENSLVKHFCGSWLQKAVDMGHSFNGVCDRDKFWLPSFSRSTEFLVVQTIAEYHSWFGYRENVCQGG